MLYLPTNYVKNDYTTTCSLKYLFSSDLQFSLLPPTFRNIQLCVTFFQRFDNSKCYSMIFVMKSCTGTAWATSKVCIRGEELLAATPSQNSMEPFQWIMSFLQIWISPADERRSNLISCTNFRICIAGVCLNISVRIGNSGSRDTVLGGRIGTLRSCNWGSICT